MAVLLTRRSPKRGYDYNEMIFVNELANIVAINSDGRISTCNIQLRGPLLRRVRPQVVEQIDHHQESSFVPGLRPTGARTRIRGHVRRP